MIMTDEKIRSTIDAYSILLLNESVKDDYTIYHAYQQALKNGTLGAKEAYHQIATASARERYAITFLPQPRNAVDIIQLNKKEIQYIGACRWLEIFSKTISIKENLSD